MKVNFGGFVPLSTVDWRGRAVCTVFLRGCPVRCSYCHNRSIQDGEDFRELEEVTALMRSSRILVSGVVFSGGEPTMQPEPLKALARASRAMGLLVGLQTNGVFPKVLASLISEKLVDRVALDIKARWERYDNLLKEKYSGPIKESLALCRDAKLAGDLPEFEVVVTLFRGYEDEVPYIARVADGVDLVLQQGMDGGVKPLSSEELRKVADRVGRVVKIRTREEGEVVYAGDRGRRVSGERQG
ncbi:MAG TPA: anaerobic ribonucleoside-triphosphate reductase activating protein [Methanomicrobiales archaeon]|nr:anaerobic ribonucleoside-triphosphate reductase activating protein [Methanomicrobiales archaeon]